MTTIRALIVALVVVLSSVPSFATQVLLPVNFTWGASGDMPVIGDFDGDGKVDPAVYRPSTGDWFILKSSTAYNTFATVHFGQAGDLPVAGDYWGMGKLQLAIFRPSTGEWLIDGSLP